MIMGIKNRVAKIEFFKQYKMDDVTFFEKIPFSREMLETYSKLYQDMQESNPKQKITNIDMPNLLNSFDSQIFKDLELFCLTNTCKGQWKPIYKFKDLSSEKIEQIFLLAKALDMSRPMFWLITYYTDLLFEKYITRNDVFEACLEVADFPLYLLISLLKSNVLSTYLFGMSKMLQISKTEEVMKHPSGMILYMEYRWNKCKIYLLERKYKCPMLCTDLNLVPLSTFQEFEKWFDDGDHAYFFHNVLYKQWIGRDSQGLFTLQDHLMDGQEKLLQKN